MKTKMYMLTAEHMNDRAVDRVAQHVEDNGMGYVIAHGMSSVFTGFASWAIECTVAQSSKIQDVVHSYNGGASCEVRELTEEETNELF
jgi:predicted Fe-Mo cluster-binding NifX family protein